MRPRLVGGSPFALLDYDALRRVARRQTAYDAHLAREEERAAIAAFYQHEFVPWDEACCDTWPGHQPGGAYR